VNYKGSLDAPPILLTSDSSKTAFYFIGSLLLFVGFAFAPYNNNPMTRFDLVLLWVIRIVSLFCCAIFFLRFFIPARLELSPSGIVLFTGVRYFKKTWSEIDKFKYMKGAYWAYLPGLIVIMDRSSTVSPQSNLKALSGGWSLNLEELTALLNSALARWGQQT
jgi:hypothetical protein